ncbi:hypothetical protein [Merismopedia glauca]|uniref:DUF4384 domain-containing protein n=1 Tax=Merismopedia glauca CCAP 1448/3 TaxID=1296344 RepID=A0A2T1C149_9CYAN|nr:hypothetical protein [Merismopedia glauca]PSB01853.1 hypothetical protein C7B64_16105 [Merismopedia glauca CCAP 1448/3]
MNHWSIFLESLGTEYKLSPSVRQLLLFQFAKERKHMSVQEIKTELERYDINTERYDDHRKRLYEAFSETCSELTKVNRGKAQILWKWLEEVYPNWHKQHIPPTLDELWAYLWRSATEGSHIFGPITQKSLESLGGIGESREREKQPSEFPRLIKVGQSINLKVKPVSVAKIIILERNKTGNIYCLCPSYLGQENTLDKEPLVILEDFTMLEEPDELQLLMIVDPELPSFDWFPISEEKSLQIGCEQLQDIFSRTTLSAKVWRNTYKVIV